MGDLEFFGESALTLDGKGRVTVPARQRDVLAALGTTKLIITKHVSGCLLLMPPAEWDALKQRLSGLTLEHEGLKRMYFGSRVEVEIDSASRVLITPELRKFAGLDKEVMLVGMEKRMELWNAARHAEIEQEAIVQARAASAKARDLVI